MQSVDLGQNAVYNFYYKGTKLSKVTFEIDGQTNGFGYDKYSYTNDLISEIKTYSNDNKLVAITRFSYTSSNKVSEVIKIEPSRNYGLRTVFTYNMDGTVTVETFSGNVYVQDNPINQNTTYSFMNNEVVKKNFTSSDLNYSIEYGYDDYHNPMKNVTGYNAIKLYSEINKGLFGFNHNLVQETTYFTPNVVDTQVEFELTYNDENFPTSRYAIGDFSGVYQYTYEYY